MLIPPLTSAPVLPRVLRQHPQQLVVVHRLQGGHVDAERVGDAGQVETELEQQVDEVHLVAGERVAQLGAGEVALRPRARVQTTVAAGVGVLLDVVDVVDVEQHRRATATSLGRHVDA